MVVVGRMKGGLPKFIIPHRAVDVIFCGVRGDNERGERKEEKKE